MITEDYVNFEIAKFLKEKGFDEKCRSYYKVFPESRVAAIYHSSENRGVSEDDSNEILCPTLQMAMKWLRKKHNLALSISVAVDGWRSCVSQIKLDSEGFVVEIIYGIDNGNIPNCDTYEEACEAAIKYCLENLI